MKPIMFDGQNATYAENQPQYLPLPALKLDDEKGSVISCWRLSFGERLWVLFSGRLWLRMSTFNKPLQPVRLTVDCPFVQMDPDAGNA